MGPYRTAADELRQNLLVVTSGPKSGQLFVVPHLKGPRKLELRNARWVVYNSTYEHISGFLRGYQSGLSGEFPE